MARSLSLPSENFDQVSSSSSVLAGERRAPRVGKIRDVAAIVKMAPSTIRAKMRSGEFPASVRLSYKLAVWNLDEVEAWFENKLKTAPVYVPYGRMAREAANG